MTNNEIEKMEHQHKQTKKETTPKRTASKVKRRIETQHTDMPEKTEPKRRIGRKAKSSEPKRGIVKRFFRAFANMFRRKKNRK